MIHIRLVESLLQLLWCPHGTYLAIHHNTDAVAIFCFVHIVGGNEDGYATLGGIVYELPELSACGGIHTAFAFMPHIFDSVILSPSKSDFFVYTWLSGLFPPGFNIDIININVTTPFFTHMKVSLWMSLLLIFPYLLFEIWLFVAPALYDGEKKSVKLAFLGVAILFYIGCVVGYIVVFPITFRFLAGYQIGQDIVTQISLDSYMSTFISIIFIMGLVFEIPVLAWLLSSLGILHKAT